MSPHLAVYGLALAALVLVGLALLRRRAGSEAPGESGGSEEIDGIKPPPGGEEGGGDA